MKIMIVDDHELFGDGLTMTLERLHAASSAEVPLDVLRAGDAEKAVSLLQKYDRLDLVLLDLDLPDSYGLKVLKTVRTMMPECPVVIISAIEKQGEIMRALDAGASGFIPKSTSTDVIIPALQLVLSGGRYLPPQMLSDTPQAKHLSDRQMEVLRHMHDGMSNKLIARKLAISESTVKVHVCKVLSVLQAKNRSHAISIALQSGIL